jgi:hypothetical protein
MSGAHEESADQSPPRVWYWPPYPLTFVIVALGGGVAFLAAYPAVEATRPGLDGTGKYGPHFELDTEYQHGWPMCYARRESGVFSSLMSLDQPLSSLYWNRASPWTPWDRAFDYSWMALVTDAIVWLGILIGVAVIVQRWRSRRQSVWQLHVVDLLGVITLIAIVVCWVQFERAQRRNERRLFTAAGGINRAPDDELGAAIPAWLPTRWQEWYLREFGRVEYYAGEPGIALQFPHLRVLSASGANHEFGELLRRMPQLEALDMCMVQFQSGDEAESFTNMRDLPPMPKLRGINLYDTNVMDAGLVWLAKCPQLECIELAGTKIGDDGLKNLAHLPKLRVLSLASERVTDDGCRTLAQIASLEDLYLSSGSVSDAGVKELVRLKRLRRLTLDTRASDAAIEDLRNALPNCSIN